jgi:Zn-dependent peptidase ImmA (M78 family)
MKGPARTTRQIIDELVRSAGAADAAEAIRKHARELIQLHVDQLGEPELPIDMEVLASLRGIIQSEERPMHSADAELVPDGTGGVKMRVNPDRPETRRRFSIAHEIVHTFFPDYTTKPWCRTDARYRDRTDPDEYLEMLCDLGAAELLFPEPWFSREAGRVVTADGMAELASRFQASREATIRRYVETSSDPLAAVFFIWKLKPVQKGRVGAPEQTHMFGLSAAEELRDALRLRIEYSITSPSFKSTGHFLPKDKSIDSDGPIYRASVTGCAQGGECFLDLGQAAGMYRVWAIPIWTADDNLGSEGENAVAAILQPVSVKPSRNAKGSAGPGLFGA